jgi:acetyltransferase-like isoleucine patch superfamily enzyme
VEGELEGPVWIGAGARVAAGAKIGPDVVVGAGAWVPAGCRVREALLLPGARLERPAGGAQLARAIAFDSEVWRDA